MLVMMLLIMSLNCFGELVRLPVSLFVCARLSVCAANPLITNAINSRHQSPFPWRTWCTHLHIPFFSVTCSVPERLKSSLDGSHSKQREI